MGQSQSKISPHAAEIKNWLLNSGIQNLSSDPKKKGGVSAWYEIDTNLYPFLYSEITGYALTTFAYLHRMTGEKVLIDRAKLAANWLDRCARLPQGGVKTRYYLVPHYETPNYSFHKGRVYTFDTAIVGYGLLQLYRLEKKQQYLDWAIEMYDFMISKMLRKDGLFYAYYDSAPKKTGEDFEKWSDQSGSFHAKLALFFADLWRETGDDKIVAVTKKMLQASLKLQKSSGRFVTSLKDQSTHLHPHCYTMEGLVYAVHVMGMKEFIPSLKKGMEWLQEAVGEDGSISTFFVNRRFDFHERSDIVAQTLRLGAILYGLKIYRNPEVKKTLERIYKHLVLFIYQGSEKQKGGMLYGAATDGLMRLHLNAWCGMFAVQAIRMYEQFVVRGEAVDLESLI